MFKPTEIKGVIPALITPFDENEKLDLKRLENLVNWLLEKGVNGFYLTGSTGEGFLMSLEERKLVVETVVKVVNKKVPVIVHVGAISTLLSIELSKHAEEVGADAISSVPPFYWRFDNKHIKKYYEDIAASTSLPMIIYNVPLTGLMGFDFIKELSTVKNVAGIKYTAYTHQDIYKCKEQISNDFMVYSGADEMALSGIFNGADGIIGSFFTMLPDLFLDIFKYVKNNELIKAQRLQKCAVAIIDASLKYDYYAVIKESMKWMGTDAGIVRRPFINLNNEEIKAVKAELLEIANKYSDIDIALFKALR